MKATWLGLLIAALISLGCLNLITAQTSPAAVSIPATVETDKGLVKIDVIPDYKAGVNVKELLTGLKPTDFRVVDDRKELPVQRVEIGALRATRPLAFWLIVQCPENVDTDFHSDFMRGHVQELRPALAHLAPDDLLGVAHWCDDGATTVDIAPGRDANMAVAAVEKFLNQPPVPAIFVGRQEAMEKNLGGQMAMQKMVRDILEDARQSTPSRMPVLLFLYGDSCGTLRNEADRIIDEIHGDSGIVFGLSNGHFRFNPTALYGREIGYLVHYYSDETGGQFYTAADPSKYSAALDFVLSQLHYRYTLEVKPPVMDGKRHLLSVELTKEAKNRFHGVQLRAPKEYVPGYVPEQKAN